VWGPSPRQGAIFSWYSTYFTPRNVPPRRMVSTIQKTMPFDLPTAADQTAMAMVRLLAMSTRVLKNPIFHDR
jgi:hypothetical protein